MNKYFSFDDAFGLASHRCSRIVHIEYRCSECDKVFNCPANLASHKRWHKPRPQALKKTKLDEEKRTSIENDVEESFPCPECGRIFKK